MKHKIKLSLSIMLACSTLFATPFQASAESVVTEGSTSMEKVIGALGESFKNETGIDFMYNPTGSSSGIKAVEEGRIDIGLSSRALKDEEKEKGLNESILAIDGIAIVVHKDNKLANLTKEDLIKIYTGDITNWKDLGGDDQEIVLIGREAGSGTRDGFESILDIKDKAKYRQELTSTGDVIATVAKNPNAIGYASLEAIKDNVQVVSINDIAPTVDTIKDGSYIIQRPFMLITSKDKALSEAAQKFVDYTETDDATSIIEKSGVVRPEKAENDKK